MAKSKHAAFAQDPQIGQAVLTAAGAQDGSDAVLIYTAGSEGALINSLKAAPRGTILANGVVFFKEKAGTTQRVAFASFDIPAWDSSVAANLTKKLPIAKDPDTSVTAPEYLGRGDKIYACLMSAAANGVGVVVTVQEFEDVGGAEV